MKRGRSLSFYGGGGCHDQNNMSIKQHVKEEEDTNFGHSDEIVYYNIIMVNNSPVSVAAESIQSLTAPLLTNATDYVMATIRFVLDGNTIPIFTFKDDTTYYVTMTGPGPSTSSQPVVFDPAVSATRSIYSYKAFITMINEAWRLAYVAIGAPGGTGPPIMVYVEETGTIDFLAPINYNPTVQCFMNSNLYGFFNNYWSIFLGEGLPSHQDYEIITTSISGTNSVSPYYKVPNNYIVMSQEYQSAFNWFDTTGIVFISNSIGVRPEFIPTTNTSNQLTTNSSAGVGPSSLPILTDFQPYINDPSGVRGYLYYASEGPWRIATLEQEEIRAIQIKIMLRDKVGNMSPYLIPPNQSVQIKLVFMPKSFYNAGKK